MSRLAHGGLIDRAKPLDFAVDGKSYRGFDGDTLASALLANDVRLVGRSFKYHRPRGILTAGAEEPNALVTLRTGAHAEPNTRATQIELFAGLEASSQNRWPNLAFDAMAVNQLAAPLFVAGFYYKTFMWPAAFWEKLYEPIIRRAAGLGALSGLPDPDTYDRAHAFCDLLVIGAGPAGLSAALAAGRAGLRVILAEEDFLLGGRLLAEARAINGAPGADWARAAQQELRASPNVRILTRTSVFGAYDGGQFGAVERITDHLGHAAPGAPRQRLWKIVAKRALIAAGAVERPLVFGGNDRPGVMTAAAVSTYLNRFAVAPGKRAAVFTTTDSGWDTVAHLSAHGVEIAAVIDARAHASPASAHARAEDIQIHQGARVLDAIGGKSLRAVRVRTQDGHDLTIACDLLAVSGGWSPQMGLGCHLGARPVWSEAIHAYVLDAPPAHIGLIGAAAGRFALTHALRDGAAAGEVIARELGRTPAPMPAPRAEDEGVDVSPLWRVEGAKHKAFVDFQHDVTDADVALAAREGYVSVEHMKRYTTLGMATDQGRTSQVNGNALLAHETGRSIADAGTILSRPPHAPISIGVLAGAHRDQHFRPMRLTPSHAWAAKNGAAFVDAGQWKRAQWYARPGESDWLPIVTREAKAVREGVGVCDVSTLGKIDVRGPDAGALLDRIYANTFSNLAVGRARYGLMLREDGFVLDDGTVARLAEDHFFITTTTANAAKIMQHIDFARQCLWPELDAQAVSVTEQWAQFAIAGPNARALLQKLLPEIDLSNESFPFMAARAFTWRGAPARLYRISFSGELAYEIAVSAQHGEALIGALMQAGEAFGVTPYGTEALGVLRIEKGHPAGNELNGQTTAHDLGLSKLLSKKKDFIGRALAAREALCDPQRPALVGIKPTDRSARLRAGAHVLARGAHAVAANDQGYVTSVCFSPALDHWIGLALIKNGPARWGERLRAYDPVRNGDIEIELCNPVFVDPEGARLRG